MIKRIKSLIRKALSSSLIASAKEKKIIDARKRFGVNSKPQSSQYKQNIIKKYANEFSIKILIETGTYYGDMVWATKDIFSHIYSIELGDKLYNKAKERFSSFDHINIIKGDSGEILSQVLKKINEPCIFWLDGHYSGGITVKGKKNSPILNELSHILNHCIEDHVIIIDDAREFVGLNDYPTVDDLREVIFSKHPNWIFEIEKDIIRIHKVL